MDILATASVMPVGGEQTSLLHAAGFTGDGKEMSFAKSFGEVASGAGELTDAMPAGQMLKETTTPLIKGVDTPTGLINLPPTDSVGERSKGTVVLTNTTVTVNVVGGSTSAQAKVAEKLVPAVPFVAEEKISQDIPSRTDNIEVSDDVASETTSGPDAAVQDVVGKTTAATVLDLTQRRPASEVVQPFGVSGGERTDIQKRVSVATAISTLEKTTKKVPTNKDHSVAAQVDSQKCLETPEGAGVQMEISVLPNGVAPLAVNVLEINRPQPNGSGSVATPGNGAGAIGPKRAQFGSRVDVEKNTLDVSKNESAVSTAKADDDLGQIKKYAPMSSKTTDVSSVDKRLEVKTFNEDEVIGVPATHSVPTTPGNIVAEATAGKARVDTASVATATGLNGSDAGVSSVGDGHRMVEMTPTALEVGVPSGTHGWLKIRAEMADGGVVNASVSATTSSGQEMLHRELPSLTTYLHEEQIGVGTVVVQTTAATGSREFTGGMESDAGREQMQQRGGQEGDSRQDAMGSFFSGSGEGHFQDQQNGTTGIEEITLRNVYAGGNWLSVRA